MISIYHMKTQRRIIITPVTITNTNTTKAAAAVVVIIIIGTLMKSLAEAVEHTSDSFPADYQKKKVGKTIRIDSMVVAM